MVCPQLEIPVMLDDFELLFVQPRQLRTRLLIDTKQFVKLECSASVSRRLARQINNVMIQTARVATAFQSNDPRSNINQSSAQHRTTANAAGRATACSTMVVKYLFDADSKFDADGLNLKLSPTVH